ncbi:Metallo-dependent hydrolase [Thermothelomyces heterothallicus CBS 203.75]
MTNIFTNNHFLHNVNIIERTKLFRLCQGMPKGAHLYIHFNANCHPSFLLNIAKEMDHMYIWSTKALTNKEAFQRCKIRFSILSEQNLKKKNPLGNLNILSSEYKTYEDLKDRGETGWMSYKTFRMLFPQHKIEGVEKDVDKWLLSKLVFSAEEAYNSRQCAAGAWDLFNRRTRMMKGLFNYQTAFVRYTQACLEEFARDNIQYAEIRLDFMPSNQLWDDEGKDQMSNERMMELIIEGYNAFQLRHQRKVFKGLKVIYCTPRSFDKPKIVFALNQCIEFKKKFPEFIAGFDLVGEKGNGNKYPLKHFAEELLEFRHKCKAENLDIPFLFHCGETLENGTDADHDLIDAILLGAKRIAHGYAVPWHPWVMQQLKARHICIELCPISNEILGLTSRIGGHSAYTALANDIVACVNTDHGGLFRSTLAHEFYQIMAGKRNMTLIGFRQLAVWSLEFSCMTPAELKAVFDDWEKMWSYFGHHPSTHGAGSAQAPHSSTTGSSAPHHAPAAAQGTPASDHGPSASAGGSAPGAHGATPSTPNTSRGPPSGITGERRRKLFWAPNKR